MADLSPGTVVKARYVLEEVLGRGGMSTVYRALDQVSGLHVAVKQLHFESLGPQAQLLSQTFHREAQLLRAVDHPNLVKVVDFFELGCNPYLVTEYVEGLDLERVVQTRLNQIEVDQITAWAEQICDVLEYLHSLNPPILFRDLKPANLVLEKHTGRLRLIDFGIARILAPGRATTGLLRGLGTPGYAPIEQYCGGTDERSDIYSLGATIYALLTGTAPPEAAALACGSEKLRPVSTFRTTVSPQLESVVMTMLALRKEDRYQSVGIARAAMRWAIGLGQGQTPGFPAACLRQRGQGPFPTSWFQANISAYRSPVSILYRGDSMETAQKIFESARSTGLPVMALLRDDFPGAVAPYWLVMVNHGGG